jgi:hypothetical protein
LEEIQSTLGVGKIHIHGKDSIQAVRRYTKGPLNNLVEDSSSVLLPVRLDPWFITGFADGDHVLLYQSPKSLN